MTQTELIHSIGILRSAANALQSVLTEDNFTVAQLEHVIDLMNKDLNDEA